MTMTASNHTAADKPLNLDAINRELQAADAKQVVRWACEAFGDGLVMTSSFGAQSAVMLHLVTQVSPGMPVIFIDTGYLFPETYQFARDLTDRLKLNLKVYSPQMTAARQEALYGKLWEQDEDGHDKYHQLNKIEPMQRALEELGVTAWLAGLRRGQTDHRAALNYVGLQNGIYKVHPILMWTGKDVHEYLKANDLPYHPLYEQGYASIGDVHSTLPITAEQHEREGRFAGSGKQECGLHIPGTAEESASRDASGL